MLVLTGSFTAEGSDGKTYVVNVFTDSGGPAATAERERIPRALKTSEGRTVIWVTTGVYKILLTGVALRTDSPDAL